jgi:hypothetical protein
MIARLSDLAKAFLTSPQFVNAATGFVISLAASLFTYWLITRPPRRRHEYVWIAIAGCVTLAVITFLILMHQPWYWVAAAIVTFAFIVVIALLAKANRILTDAGIHRVWTRNKFPVERCYDEMSDRYRWFGFSAVKEIADDSIIERVISIPKKLQFEYIILDPRNELAAHHQASIKKATVDRIRQQLDDTETSVRMLQNRKIDVSLLKHSLFPTFRVTLIDDKRILVGAYEAGSADKPSAEYSGGFFSDFVELRESGGKSLLFKWFSLYYQREKLHAEKSALERFAIGERFRFPGLSVEDLIQRARDAGLTYGGEPVTHDVMQSLLREFGIP